MSTLKYEQFLRSKMVIAPESGFEVDRDTLCPLAKGHQKDATWWALKGGWRAIFASFGMGKTLIELMWCQAVATQMGGKTLIVLPLGVRQEFRRDAAMLLGIVPPVYVRNMWEVNACKHSIMLTNYERVRDGDIEPRYFTGVCLDEASVLRGDNTKTYHTFMKKFEGVQYKVVATATPSPNDYIEILQYASFLGVMDKSQAKTRFFQRDSEKADNLTILPHKEEEFWLWVSTWALFISKPSDLGYSDEGYILPKMEIRYHEIPVDHRTAGTDKDGQVKMLRDAAESLPDALREKRESIGARISKMMEIVNAAPEEHFILWHDLEAERKAIEGALPAIDYVHWHEYKDGNAAGLKLYNRHYSAYQYADGRERKLFCGPGEKQVLLTSKQDALFVWRKFKDDSGQQGINCSVFRYEGNTRSSDLIQEAMAIAWLRWPGERLYTYVNAMKVQSSNPGYCFIKAGWKRCGETKGGLVILEALPGVDVPDIQPKTAMQTVYGKLDIDQREQRVIDFADGKFRLLATKKEISGEGGNFQRYCHRAIFLGIDYKFNDFIQAIHRIHRFGQKEKVIIDIIYTESERKILADLKEKWRKHDKQQAVMADLLRRNGLSNQHVIEKMGRSIGVKRMEVTGQHFKAVLNDCILEAEQMRENSVGLIHTSLPFGTQYEYSLSYNDLGHNENTARFFEQMDYLTPNLLRVLMPGRVLAVHVKDRIVFGNYSGEGMVTVEPFHSHCISHFMKHGFRYTGMITVVTDVVRENNQTYRLGWSEQCKDGSKMSVGLEEYVLLFRKLPSNTDKSYADDPVVKSKEEYTRAQWQIDAHGYWRASGDVLLSKEDILRAPKERIQEVYRKYSRGTVYDYREHVEIAKQLDKNGKLPAKYMVVAPGSWDDMVWDDIARIKSLNTRQSRERQQLHLCPLPIDIVDRVINRYSNKGDVVFDPFGGLMTVPVRAVALGREGIGCELNEDYFRDGVGYLKEADAERDVPTLFDFLGIGKGA